MTGLTATDANAFYVVGNVVRRLAWLHPLGSVSKQEEYLAKQR